MLTINRTGRLQNPLPLLFDDFFNREVFNNGLMHSSATATTIPAVNIKETSEQYEVELAAPGMQKSDFKIQLDGQKLTISSEKETTHENEGENNFQYINREYSYQSFSRTFTLRDEVLDTEKIEAKYENGVLSLLVPKKEHAKQKAPRLINVS